MGANHTHTEFDSQDIGWSGANTRRSLGTGESRGLSFSSSGFENSDFYPDSGWSEQLLTSRQGVLTFEVGGSKQMLITASFSDTSAGITYYSADASA